MVLKKSSRTALEKAVDTAGKGAASNVGPRAAIGVTKGVGISAPGMLLHGMTTARDLEVANATIAKLQQQGNPRLIDPATVRRSRFADRDDGLMTEGAEWTEFCRQIKAAGGNTVAVEVIDHGEWFETIFGHRRTAACLHLGLLLKANVYDELDDKSHWLAMRRENEGGKALSVIEKGRSFKRALTAGFFTKAAEISEVTGEGAGNISLALKAAELPDGVLQAIGDWREVTWAQARALVSANERDNSALQNRAGVMPAALHGCANRVNFIVNAVPAKEDSQTIVHAGSTLAKLLRKTDGSRVITLNWSLSNEDDAALIKWLETYAIERGTLR